MTRRSLLAFLPLPFLSKFFVTPKRDGILHGYTEKDLIALFRNDKRLYSLIEKPNLHVISSMDMRIPLCIRPDSIEVPEGY